MTPSRTSSDDRCRRYHVPAVVHERTPHADLLREKIGFPAKKLMEVEVSAATGAANGEKSPLRMVPQWLPRPGLGGARWHVRAVHSKATEGFLLPELL